MGTVVLGFIMMESLCNYWNYSSDFRLISIKRTDFYKKCSQDFGTNVW